MKVPVRRVTHGFVRQGIDPALVQGVHRVRPQDGRAPLKRRPAGGEATPHVFNPKHPRGERQVGSRVYIRAALRHALAQRKRQLLHRGSGGGRGGRRVGPTTAACVMNSSLCREVHLDRLRQSFHPAALAHLAQGDLGGSRAPRAGAPRPRVRNPEHRLRQGRRHLDSATVRGGDSPAPESRELGLGQRREREPGALDASTANAKEPMSVERMSALLLPRVHHRGVPVPREHRVARGREKLGVLAVHAAGVARPRPGVREEQERGEEGAVGVDDIERDTRVCGPRHGIHAVARAPLVADAGPRALQVATGAPRRLESVEGNAVVVGRGQRLVVSGGRRKGETGCPTTIRDLGVGRPPVCATRI